MNPLNRVITAFILFITVTFIGCSAIQKYIDRKGLESSCSEIIQSYKHGDPEGFSGFIREFSPDAALSPFETGMPERADIGNWRLDFDDAPAVVQEKLVFRTKLSAITHEKDRLVVYLYSSGNIKESRVMIFVPGMGVSDFALKFIHRFFRSIIKNGYTLAVYVPPYHMDRIPPGGKSGADFFTSNHERNIRMIAGCTSELRSLVRYFNKSGAAEVSGWGGSMGASFLLLSAAYEKYGNITVMIPVLDWNTLLLDSPYLCPMKDKMQGDGWNLEDVRSGYSMVSPVNVKLKIKPERFMIMFGEFDQLTPLSTLETYRARTGNPVTKFYPRSHSTILTDFGVYEDYDRQLVEWGSR